MHDGLLEVFALFSSVAKSSETYKMVSSKILSVLLLLFRQTSASGTDFLVLPLEVTREFTCASPPGRDYVIVWLVNGSSAARSVFQDYIDVGEEVHLDSGVLQRNLTLTADTRANNTHIHCDVYPFGGEQYTAVDMNIILQGQLCPPTVDMARNTHSVVFSWSAPFTLNISDMEPDILHYVVYIIRDDGHNETVNTTDTHYELQADPCQSHQYQVKIAAVNVVGEGENYSSSPLIFEEFEAVSVLYRVVSFNKGIPVITLQITPNIHEEIMYEVELNGKYSNETLFLRNNSGNEREPVHFTSESILKDELYSFSVRIEGVQCHESEPARGNLSTFDVQHVEIDNHDEYVDVICHFAQGSEATGCIIKAETQQKQSNNTVCQMVVPRNPEDQARVRLRLPEGTYTILAYDEENESTVSGNPATNMTIDLLTSVQVTVSVAAAGGLLLPIVTIFIRLTVSVVLFRREKRKAAIAMTTNTAYEEVKLKQKKRRTTPSHGQPVLKLNHESVEELAVSTRMDTNVAYGVVP